MKKIALLGLIITSIFLACNKDEDPPKDFTIGKNLFTTMVDGDEREYYVHVPTGYDENNTSPVVFMLHGTSQDGLWHYDNSPWKELGDDENILTVFPSSGRYCIIDDGQVKNTTKWNVFPGPFEYCENEIPRDDIKFLRQIISELNQRFNVDNKKIHLAGFSNGGQMAFRCAVQMSDVFASIVESGGSYAQDTIFTPQRNVPITFQLGSSDDMWFGGIDVPLTLFDSLLNNYPLFQRIVGVHVNSFNFESTYTISGDSSSALIATFKGIPEQGNRNFNFVFIKSMGHVYPNGTNHPINGARQNWEWMKQYTLP